MTGCGLWSRHLDLANRATYEALDELRVADAGTLIAIVTNSTGPSTSSKKGYGSR